MKFMMRTLVISTALAGLALPALADEPYSINKTEVKEKPFGTQVKSTTKTKLGNNAMLKKTTKQTTLDNGMTFTKEKTKVKF